MLPIKSAGSQITKGFVSDVQAYLAAFFYGAKLVILKSTKEDELKNSPKVTFYEDR